MMKIKFIREYRAIKLNKQNASSQTFKYREGDVLDEVLNEEAQWLIDNGFAEEVKEGKWWKPKNGVDYYYVNDAGVIFSREGFLSMSTTDDRRVDIGNAFRSKAAAERYRDYLEAVATVSQDEGFMKYNKTCCEFWELRRMYLDVNGRFTAHKVESEFLHHLGAFYFDTEEHAIASSEKHHSEWETILNYDWSKGEDEEDEN